MLGLGGGAICVVFERVGADVVRWSGRGLSSGSGGVWLSSGWCWLVLVLELGRGIVILRRRAREGLVGDWYGVRGPTWLVRVVRLAGPVSR